MRTMSFNLLCAPPSEQRADALVQTIKKYSPDTVGVQEATPQWMQILREGLGDEYEFVGGGREGGEQGEHCAIGYKKSVFDFIETQTKWLSDTPDTVSQIEGCLCTRIYTYAKLKCKKCGKVITYINTHLDHVHFRETENEIRAAQAGYIAEFVKTLGDTYVMLTGDLNSLPNDASIRVLKSSGLSNCSEIAKTSDDSSTFKDITIDYIFAYEKLTDVSEYKVCYDKVNGEFPSDHRPIYIDYKFI